MDGGTLILIELLLVVGVLFWFGFSQLASLRRDREERERPRVHPGTDRRSRGPAGTPERL